MKLAHSYILFLFALSCAHSVVAGSYNLADNIVGSGFYNAFKFEAISDPTHGRVNYVDYNTAISQNLTYSSSNTFVLRSDYKSKLSASGPGRNSVRLLSNRQYSTHVALFNVRHMPQGCGTWPALWEVGADWPNQGETDIIEGVNDVTPNQASLHTSTGCTMPSSGRTQTGISGNLDCQWYNGCGVQSESQISYGPAFNNNGGGWYAIERTNTFLKFWFWPRNVGNPPADVRSPGSTVNTANWGTPFAHFPNTQCNIASKFGPHKIVINLTFCGDWAGAVYGNSGCPLDCDTYVNQNPGAFINAYWQFDYIRTYT